MPNLTFLDTNQPTLVSYSVNDGTTASRTTGVVNGLIDSTVNLRFTVTVAGTLYYKITASTEPSYDQGSIFRVRSGSATLLNTVSGSQVSESTVSVLVGDIIRVDYQKDDSGTAGLDRITIDYLYVEPTLVDPYCVAGAGTTVANGTYSFNSSSYNQFMYGYWQHITQPLLKMGQGMMGDYEIINDSTRLYYSSSLTGLWSTDYGTASAPTVTAGACSSPTPTPAPTVTAISPTTGTTAGGTSVTITGTNLTGATAVSIGGTAATNVTVVSSTSITATTPAGTAGTASVLVTTPSGTNAANSLFTFVAPNPSPSPSPSPTTANIIRPKRSSTASATPTGLAAYEIAVNITDKKIWVADATGAPVLMSELNDLPPSIDGGTF